MGLVLKILETLNITPLAILQMALLVILAAILSGTLIRPVLATFKEREDLSEKPVEEARRLAAEAEAKVRRYDESLRAAAAEARARKRAQLEEASRTERTKVEGVAEGANREVEALRERIGGEKAEAARALQAGVSRFSREIAAKVLGRRPA